MRKSYSFSRRFSLRQAIGMAAVYGERGFRAIYRRRENAAECRGLLAAVSRKAEFCSKNAFWVIKTRISSIDFYPFLPFSAL